MIARFYYIKFWRASTHTANISTKISMRFYSLLGFVLAGLFINACAPHTAGDTASVKSDDMKERLLPQDYAITSKAIFLTTSQACKPYKTHSALLSFVGDNVLGDYKGSSGATFNAKFQEVGKDVRYFTQGVREVLQADDLTIGNMEGVLSDKPLKNAFDKPFSFKGQSGYAKILVAGGFEAMNLANNHSRDYGSEGFADTIAHLKAHKLAVFGEGLVHIYEVNGIKIGLAGHRGWNPAIKSQVKKEIETLKAQGADLVIFTFHWGEEREHYPNATQKDIARFSIDSGADMVIGHHPHVLQGVQTYNGKKVVYSLGNFIYGGAKNPSDKDTIIYQTRIIKIPNDRERREFIEDLRYDVCAKIAYFSKPFIDGVERVDEVGEFVFIHSVIPASISQTPSYNDYAPRIYESDSKGFARILERLATYSRITPQTAKKSTHKSAQKTTQKSSNKSPKVQSTKPH